MPANTLNKSLSPIYTAACLFIVVAAGIIIYSNTFDSPFLFDDEFFIVNDYEIRMTELSWNAVKLAALEGFPPHRYLPNISWALNYYFGQLNPFGYHLVNLIIHLLSGVFLFSFIKNTLRIAPGGSHDIHPELIAFFAALIWIVQPVATQSVTYICQRMASMVALFYILSLLLYVKGRMAMRTSPSDWLKPCLYFSGCLLSAICAIASKENAGTLPLVILLYEWFFFQNLKLNFSRHQLLWLAFFIIVFAGVALWCLRGNPLIYIVKGYAHRDFNLPQRVMTEWRIMVYYITLFLWAPPGRLNLDHDYPLSFSPVDPPATIITLAAILGLFTLAIYSAKKDRLIAFGIFWFFITQATESTIISIELIFEHRTYIPFMMTSLLFVLAVFRLVRIRRIAYGLLTATALVFSFWTYQRNQIWQDPVTFWSDAMAKSSDKPRAMENMAFAYQQKENWTAAVFYYKKALNMDDAIDKSDFATYANLGAALTKQNCFFDAVYYYSMALELREGEDVPHLFQPMAFLLSRIGELEMAKHYYHLALNIYPDDESAKKGLTAVTEFLSHFTDQDAQIRQLRAEYPDNPALMLKQGDLLNRHGFPEKAIVAYQAALALTDDNDEILNRAILSRLAKAYFLTRRLDDALAVYLHLITMTPDNAMLYYNIAAVYAVQGKISKTKAFLKKAADKGLDMTEKIKTDPNFEKIRELEVEKWKRVP